MNSVFVLLLTRECLNADTELLYVELVMNVLFH